MASKVLPVISVIGEDRGVDDTWMEKDLLLLLL